MSIASRTRVVQVGIGMRGYVRERYLGPDSIKEAHKRSLLEPVISVILAATHTAKRSG